MIRDKEENQYIYIIKFSKQDKPRKEKPLTTNNNNNKDEKDKKDKEKSLYSYYKSPYYSKNKYYYLYSNIRLSDQKLFKGKKNYIKKNINKKSNKATV